MRAVLLISSSSPPKISEGNFLLDPPLAEAGEVKTKGEQNMKTNYDRADAD